MKTHEHHPENLPHQVKALTAKPLLEIKHRTKAEPTVTLRLRVRRVQCLMDIGLSDREVAQRCDMALEKIAGLRRYYGL